ncbi:DUF2173 family protein [Halorarum salinum]|uniref:DUF2173 family protein n=1 Tax=Halorarum salinum TaxID=2743089 RepID=A0A7D5QF74_9EURY|nr:DUF2173 family protein [Halobaculum salinum]QLG61182.1 DUF2173 family protein [Halobaculum salinum]
MDVSNGGSLPTLKELLEIDGVVAAGEFSPAGSLVDYETNVGLSEEVAANAAQFCASVSMLFDTLADAFGETSGMEWTPQRGWAYSGGKYTVAVGGDRGVFAETGEADFDDLFAALVGSR